jgi:dolichol-phosphate mannosyltransferase
MSQEPITVAVVIPAYNESIKLQSVIRRIPEKHVGEVIIVDDGSNHSYDFPKTQFKLTVLRHQKRQGVGAALRTGYDYAIKNNYEVLITLAGNNKDFPEDIPELLKLAEKFDLVQGSRYLSENIDFGEMPAYRLFTTRYLHPMICSVRMSMKMTDTTNGFRLIQTRILKDSRLGLRSNLFDKYSYEVSLLILARYFGYRITEFPTRKVYPTKSLGQTKMRPILGWWSILWPTLVPIFFLKKMGSKNV